MKKITKILSIVLAVSILLSAFVSVSAENATEYREVVALDDNFESTSVGSVPSGWNTEGDVRQRG